MGKSYPAFPKRKIPLSLGEKKYSNAFSRIELVQQTNANPISFHGPGEIFQDESGRLRIKVYHSYTNDEREMFFDVGGEVGKFYGIDKMFRLRGTDMGGIEWTAENIWVKKDLRFPSVGEVINVEVERVKTEKHIKNTEKFKIEISAYGNYTTPHSSFVRFSDGSLNRVMHSLNHAHLEISTIQTFELLFIIIEGKRSDYYPEMSTILLEALGIVNGGRLSVATQTTIMDGKEIIELSGNNNSGKNKINPPIPAITPLDGEDFSEFVQKYLTKIQKPFSTLYMNWFKICDTSENNLDNIALIQSTAVEGLLHECFEKYGIPKGDEIGKINDLISLIKSSSLDSNIVCRALGSINNMKNQNARRALKELKNEKIISSKMEKAWNSRNSLAHGNILSAGGLNEMQKALDDSNSVITLFYILVLRYIGYSKRIIDYSTDNWPMVSINNIFPDDENRK